LLDNNHTPKDCHNKHRTCFIINKRYKSERIHPLDGGSQILSALELDIKIDKIDKIRLINVYNPPPPENFDALAKLNSWLTNFNDQNTPSFIFMDPNLPAVPMGPLAPMEGALWWP
jgi:hypothetical protein